jgi:hypothetical protein
VNNLSKPLLVGCDQISQLTDTKVIKNQLQRYTVSSRIRVTTTENGYLEVGINCTKKTERETMEKQGMRFEILLE